MNVDKYSWNWVDFVNWPPSRVSKLKFQVLAFHQSDKGLWRRVNPWNISFQCSTVANLQLSTGWVRLELPCYTPTWMQHNSFFRSLPPLFTCLNHVSHESNKMIFWYFSNTLVLLSSFGLLDVYHGLAFGKDIKKMPWPLFVEHLHWCLGLPLSVQKDWEKNGS